MMNKRFNITGLCVSEYHYMVDITERLEKIKAMIDRGDYFVINRGRQYGKTTTLNALRKYLSDSYYVISMDFQRQMSSAKFKDEHSFSVAFVKAFIDSLKRNDCTDHILPALNELKECVNEDLDLVELFLNFSRFCGSVERPIVLMIDEVDQASNNQVFLDFLAQLRGYYLDRFESPTFRSVILAGVYDVRNLKLKICEDAEHKHNSPWNIAVDFNIDMSLGVDGITGMLDDYAKEHEISIDSTTIAQVIYDYTSGYPVLVSSICKLIDEEIKGWTEEGVIKAVNQILSMNTPLFDSLILNRFIEHFHEIYSDITEKFIEEDGRKCFLVYLHNIINGVGNYYIEVRTRNNRRMDVVIDYLGKRYVIELKICHGKKYNEDGEKQLSDYLDSYKLKTGYMLTFSFNKNKETGIKTVQYEDKTLIEAVV